MPRAIRRAAEVLLPRGGVNSGREWIEGWYHSTRHCAEYLNNNRAPCLGAPNHLWPIWSINLKTRHAISDMAIWQLI